MAVLKVALLGAGFAKDPAITLKDYLETNYTISTPAKAQVNFDTKFSRFDKYNHIIVENINYPVRPITLGMARFQYEDIKRVQIWCGRASAKNNAFLIKEHIDDIINANPLGMQVDGIEYAIIKDWNPISTLSVPANDEEIEVKSTEVYRLSALVSLFYDKHL